METVRKAATAARAATEMTGTTAGAGARIGVTVETATNAAATALTGRNAIKEGGGKTTNMAVIHRNPCLRPPLKNCRPEKESLKFLERDSAFCGTQNGITCRALQTSLFRRKWCAASI